MFSVGFLFSILNLSLCAGQILAVGTFSPFLFVTGGYDDVGWLSSSEIIWLGSSDTLLCDNPADFPVAVDYASAGTVNGHPVVCGGTSGINEVYNNCYEGSNTFAADQARIEYRFLLRGYSDHYLSSTEVYSSTSGPGFVFGEELPAPRDGHCVGKIDDDTYIVAGGFGGADLSYQRDILIYTRSTSTWSVVGYVNQTDMTGQACGIVHSEHGVEFVMAGDFDDEVSRVEIFNVRSYELREGPPLPKLLSEMVAVQMGSSFLLVGGIDFYDGPSDKIYLYHGDGNGSWQELDAKLQVPRFAATATLVSSAVANCP